MMFGGELFVMRSDLILSVESKVGYALQALQINEVAVVLGAMAQQAMRGQNQEQRDRFITSLIGYAEWKPND